ncbi:hypothetical protein ACJJIL_17640 [Microbulbifer sp. EKSA005]|uniref:hypothetical protein n=1 Tax=Microbulbifer sp. EKSA005 TaxID=3243364 RepID=UPI0040415ECD
MDKFPITTNRYIAYFDIMGFKDMIYRNTHEQVSEVMDGISVITSSIKNTEMRLLESSQNKKLRLDSTVVLPVIFSDSILFISKSDSPEDLEKILFVSAYFLQQTMELSIPVKGAVAHGLFTADFVRSKFYGRPLVDAYMLAEDTYFYGAAMHDTIESRLDNNLKGLLVDKLIMKGKLPMKGGLVTHYFLDWRYINFYGSPSEYDSYINDEVKKVLTNFYKTVSGKVRMYVDNTIKLYTRDFNQRAG